MSKNMGFLNDFNKSVDKIDGVGRSSQPPRYWYPTGNYVLNKIISSKYPPTPDKVILPAFNST